MKKDEVKKLIEQGVRELNDALAAGDSQQLKEFMAVMARFPRYSFNNCLLIVMQKPDAQMVQGFHAWKKAGRWVKKGEKGIGIVAPMVYRNKEEKASEDGEERMLRGFKVVHVYDVSQTEGKEMPEFARVTGDAGHYIDAVERVIRAKGIELLYEEIASGADGVSRKGSIVIDPKLEGAERFAVLTHELAHEMLHWDKVKRLLTTKTIRETEAEAVAHVVCRAVGLDSTTHSADYIRLYSGDLDVLAGSLDGIQKAAAQILELLGAAEAVKEEAAA
ncbi:ArdC family protein [Botrimarina sp.]|uniref:ArdC family protein n=1 Tax=Botrimarina sp. TaxID=2795802 RepID=UPI0032EEC021